MVSSGMERHHRTGDKRHRPRDRDAEGPLASLMAKGIRKELHSDIDTAVQMENGTQLVDCHGEMTDRFDVRHLLTSLEDLPATSGDITDSEDTIESTGALSDAESCPDLEELNYERFCDVDSDEEHLFELDPEDVQAYLRHKKRRNDDEAEDRGLRSNEIHLDYKAAGLIDDDPRSARDEKKDAANDDTVPPADAKQAEILHRTVQFIMQQPNPNTAEIMIQGKQGGNPLFSFLHRGKPYNAYYEAVKRQIAAGTWVKPATTPASPTTPEEGGQSASIGPKRPEDGAGAAARPPPPPKGTLQATEEEMDAVRKTARFVGKNGVSFESMLRQRHAGDPRFQFLNPWHQLHTTYRALVQKEAMESQD